MLPDHKIHASNRPYFHIDFKNDIEFLRVIHVRLIFKIFIMLSFVSKYLVLRNDVSIRRNDFKKYNKNIHQMRKLSHHSE